MEGPGMDLSSIKEKKLLTGNVNYKTQTSKGNVCIFQDGSLFLMVYVIFCFLYHCACFSYL